MPKPYSNDLRTRVVLGGSVRRDLPIGSEAVWGVGPLCREVVAALLGSRAVCLRTRWAAIGVRFLIHIATSSLSRSSGRRI